MSKISSQRSGKHLFSSPSSVVNWMDLPMHELQILALRLKYKDIYKGEKLFLFFLHPRHQWKKCQLKHLRYPPLRPNRPSLTTLRPWDHHIIPEFQTYLLFLFRSHYALQSGSLPHIWDILVQRYKEKGGSLLRTKALQDLFGSVDREVLGQSLTLPTFLHLGQAPKVPAYEIAATER